jgi:hypothetical protein
MYIAFLHGIQKEDQEGVPAEKFNFWINKIQEDWLTERSRQFDTDQKRIDDLFLLRTERVINTNGTRSVVANSSLRILSDGSGTMLIDPERYFNISGLSFYAPDSTTGTIDLITGEVSNAIVGDAFYALVYYSELEFPIVNMLTVGQVLITTHTGSLLTTKGDYYAFLEVATDLDDPWGDLVDATADPITFRSFTDYRFLVPNGYPNPKYFRLMNVQFRITYVDNHIFPDGISSWLKAQLMRADQRADIYQNAYRYPTDEKPYYRLLGEFIEFINETLSTPLKMKIEYLRYPKSIKYVEPTSDDVAIDCELPSIQQKEIVDMAVRMYIEATQSPRYQSQVVEEQIKDKFE